MKKLILNLTIFFTSSVVSVAVCEGAVRLLIPQQLVRSYVVPDENLTCRFRPDFLYIDAYGNYDGPYKVRINNSGFRMNEEISPDPDVRKVLFTGDSFTFGWGVDVENSFYGILSGQLSNLKKTQLINAGVGGSSTAHVILRNEDIRKKIDYTSVVYFLSPNDLYDNLSRHPDYRVMEYHLNKNGTVSFSRKKVFSEGKRFLLNNPLYVRLNQNSHLFILIKKIFSSHKSGDLPNMIPDKASDSQKSRLAITISKAYVEMLISQTSDMGVSLAIIPIPMLEEFKESDMLTTLTYKKFKSDLMKLSIERRFFYFDPLERMKSIVYGSGISPEDLFFKDRHFNVIGNKIFAESLESRIRNFI